MMLITVVATCGCLLIIAYLGREALGLGTSMNVTVRQNIRSMVTEQRGEEENSFDLRSSVDVSENAADDNADALVMRTTSTQLNLQKRLKFAQLSETPPYVFALAQIVLSIGAFALVQTVFMALLQVASLLSGPMIVNTFINYRMQRRFSRFDNDYPQFLLSFVAMLKTGLNPMQALETAASGLDDRSLVRQEVELMLERLRLGVSEERSIGSFGEDINHPEIELFVQSLLLSRRVGGNLSDTIDRLARQVRKRQHFRASAVAAVGLQRGSIWFILAILCALEGYIYIAWPECIILTWTDPKAAPIAQVGLCMIIFGLYLVRQVTKIKV